MVRYREKTFSEGFRQLSTYIDTLGEKEGWLIIFDRSTRKSWDEKIYWDEKMLENRVIRVIGC